MNLNKAFLIGRLTRDPEIRMMPSGQQVASFGLATDRFYTDKTSNQRQQKTEFHNVVMFGRLAEIASQYLKKGALLMVEGRLQTRDWQDAATGQKRYRTEIIAESMQLGPRSGNESSASASYGETKSAYSKTSPASAENYSKAKPANTGASQAPQSEPDIPIIEEDNDIDVKNIPF